MVPTTASPMDGGILHMRRSDFASSVYVPGASRRQRWRGVFSKAQHDGSSKTHFLAVVTVTDWSLQRLLDWHGYHLVE